MSKLAIFFPGIGYTNDKPLLYYSRKIASDNGYEIVLIEYSNLPEKIKGDKEKMKAALMTAYEQCVDKLKNIDFDSYEDVLIVGKSLGTVVAAKYHAEHCKKARLVLYTPVEATFMFSINKAIAFIGDNDSWSDLATVKELANKANVPLHLYVGCNHSLEVEKDYAKNIDIIKNVMELTSEFIG